MKIKSRTYIKCDICGNEIDKPHGHRKIKLYEWFYTWRKFDLCLKCALTLEDMVREKVRNKEGE